MNILFIDMETTGLDDQRHAPVQIAAEYYEGNILKKTFNEKFYRGHGTIDLGALKVNKTSLRSLEEYPSESEVVKSFVDFILSFNSKEPVILAGECIKFDYGFLDQLLKNHGIEGLGAIFSHRTIDTATLALFLKDAGLLKVEKLGLENVAKHLGLVEPEADVLAPKFHDAGYDTHKTAQVYFALVDLIKSKI